MSNELQRPLKIKGRAFLLTLFFSFVQFLSYYISNFFFSDSEPILYVCYFLGRFLNTAIPVISAAALYLCATGGRDRVLIALLFGLSRFGYTLPYWYMEMVVDVYDSVEAILLSALISIGMAIIIGIEIFLYDFIIRLASGNGGNLCGKAFDLENRVTFGILMAGAARLAVNLIQEIYTAISFFIESTNVSLSEIIYLTVSFILHILFWPATHALLCFIKNREIKRL